MQYLLSNEKLMDLSEEFCVIDGEISQMICLLWQVRNLLETCLFGSQGPRQERLIKLATRMDNAISYEIIQLLEHQNKVAYMKHQLGNVYPVTYGARSAS